MKCDKCGTELSNPGVSFCPTCGSYINKVKVEDKKIGGIVKIDNKNDNKYKMTGFVIVSVIVLIIILLVVLLIPKSNDEEYFFKGVDEEEVIEEKKEEVTKPTSPGTPVKTEEPKKPDSPPKVEKQTNPFDKLIGVSKSGYAGKPKSNTQTKIIHDRQYFKQITVKDKNEVLALIKYDSDIQKTGCNTNVGSIENSIASNYGITAVNLCEMDYTFARELANVARYIYNSYPTARNHMTNFTLANLNNNSSYMAAYMPIFTFVTNNSTTGYPMGIKSQIILNAKYFLDKEKIQSSVRYGTSSGYFPKNATRSSTVAHEFGHYLSFVAMLKYYQVNQLTFITITDANTLYHIYDDFNEGNFSYKILNAAYEDYKLNYGNNMTFDQFRASISQYAMAKDSNGQYIYDETIAESFHDCYLNGNNAQIASKLIMNRLKSYL